MILYSDEDVGTKVPRALKLVGLKVVWAASNKGISEPDIKWLERVGNKGWLGLSCNKDILNVPEERDTILNKDVGIIFFNSGNLHPKDKLTILLKKWSWMEKVDSSVNRPFAFILYGNGLVKQVL